MNQQISVPASKLDFDLENPRFPVQTSQREALEKTLLSNMSKSLKLAEHLVENGQNPSDPLLVLQAGVRFTTLEGNRRTAVLKVLNKPILLDSMPDGAGMPAFRKKMKVLAERAINSDLNKIAVVVVPSRAAADVWINLKHTGENDGAGTVQWDGNARARKRAKGDIGLELLDFGKAKNWFTDDELKGPNGTSFPLTTLNRLLGDPQVREALGLTLSNNILLSMVPPEELEKGIKQIVSDLASGEWNVTRLKVKNDRKKYIDQLPNSARPDLTQAVGPWQVDVDIVTPAAPAKVEPQEPRTIIKPSTRKALVPKDFVVNSNSACPRLAKILLELKRLEVERHENAVAVLLRTYIELSLDDYIERTGLPVQKSGKQATLAEKAKSAAANFKSQGRMDKHMEGNINRLVGQNSDPKAEMGSITTLHSFVHSRLSNPIASELKTVWDNIAPFMRLVSQA